jgi:peptide deformylase
MVREIVTYPNIILRKKSKDVEVFDKKLHTLLNDMNDTMMERGGVGLAAIQVAVPLNVLIINIPIEDKNSEDHEKQLPENLIEAINPVITHKDGELLFNEGCLSVPGFNADVKRAKHVIVEYYNRDGKKNKVDAEDFFAVAWQQELELLEGHLFVENLSFLKRKKFEKEWKRELKEKSKNRNK